MITIFKIFNIPIKLHWSFPLLFALFIKSGIAVAVTIAVCILLHELGHALVAKKWNQKVLDIVLMAFGGLTNVEGIMPSPRGQIMIMGAGPLVNLVLAILAIPFMFIPGLHVYANLFFVLNLILGLGNLIPVYPLDGGRILNALLQTKFELIKSLKISVIVGSTITAILVPLFFMWEVPYTSLLFVVVAIFGWLDYKRHKKDLALVDSEHLLS